MAMMRNSRHPLLPGARWLAATGLVAALLAQPAVADARFDYLLHCGGCHLENGSGSPPDVPDLRLDLDTILAIPGGRAYLASVPGAAQAPLSDAQLAAVLNWIVQVYYAELRDFPPFTAEEIAGYRGPSMLDPLRYRAELLARHR
jgi:cytochrome c peroxidase